MPYQYIGVGLPSVSPFVGSSLLRIAEEVTLS